MAVVLKWQFLHLTIRAGGGSCIKVAVSSPDYKGRGWQSSSLACHAMAGQMAGHGGRVPETGSSQGWLVSDFFQLSRLQGWLRVNQ